MECPNCNEKSIPFARWWIRGGMGKYQCGACQAMLKTRRNIPLTLMSGVLGGLSVLVGYYYRSWIVLIVALILALTIDALMDSKFRNLSAVPND